MPAGKKRSLSDKWRLTSLSNKIITIATVVIAAAGVLTFGTAVFQWLEMRGAGTQTNKIIAADERLAKAMEDAVKQGEKSFKAANAQVDLSQRAWIQVRVFNNSPLGRQVLGEPLPVRVVIKNTGRTPALNARDSIACMINRENVGQEAATQKHPGFKPKDWIALGIVTPDNEIVGDFPISAFTSDMIQVYVMGRIEYDDVFGVHHWINFCRYLTSGGLYAVCQHNNDIDSNKDPGHDE